MQYDWGGVQDNSEKLPALELRIVTIAPRGLRMGELEYFRQPYIFTHEETIWYGVIKICPTNVTKNLK